VRGRRGEASEGVGGNGETDTGEGRGPIMRHSEGVLRGALFRWREPAQVSSCPRRGWRSQSPVLRNARGVVRVLPVLGA
jgi:hypothetical protein